MKTSELIVMGSFVFLCAQGQTTGGDQNQSQTPPSPPQSSQTLPPGLEKRDQLPPGLQGREELPPGLAKRTNQFGTQFPATPNQAAVTNQFGVTLAPTNQPATSSFGTNVTPAGSAGFTNRVYATNTFRSTNQTSITLQDQAFTEQDRTLLVQVRQAVLPRLQVSGAWAPAVHFQVREGVVTIVGTVQTIEIKQEVEVIVVRTPGVVRVINQLIVGSSNQASDADQVLLTRVRQTVMPQLRAGGITVPVDFEVQQGVVTLVGTLPSGPQRDRVITLVKQVPGVVQVQ